MPIQLRSKTRAVVQSNRKDIDKVTLCRLLDIQYVLIVRYVLRMDGMTISQ